MQILPVGHLCTRDWEREQLLRPLHNIPNGCSIKQISITHFSLVVIIFLFFLFLFSFFFAFLISFVDSYANNSKRIEKCKIHFWILGRLWNQSIDARTSNRMLLDYLKHKNILILSVFYVIITYHSRLVCVFMFVDINSISFLFSCLPTFSDFINVCLPLRFTFELASFRWSNRSNSYHGSTFCGSCRHKKSCRTCENCATTTRNCCATFCRITWPITFSHTTIDSAGFVFPIDDQLSFPLLICPFRIAQTKTNRPV